MKRRISDENKCDGKYIIGGADRAGVLRVLRKDGNEVVLTTVASVVLGWRSEYITTCY